MIQVTICYHVGWLGPVPPSAFETEVRQRLIADAEGAAFSLDFRPKPGVGILGTDEQVLVESSRPRDATQWTEVIGSAILPEAWEAVARRFGYAAR